MCRIRDISLALHTVHSRWDEAVSRHKQAYAAWASILTGIPTDPMPALDGRTVEGNSSTAK